MLDDIPADFYLGQLQSVLRSVLNSNPPELEGNGAQSGELLMFCLLKVKVRHLIAR